MVLLAVALQVVAACGDGDAGDAGERATTTETRADRSTTSVEGSPTSSSVPAATPPPRATSTCSPPHPPGGREQWDQERLRDDLNALLPYEGPWANPDSDGDGRPDVIEDAGGSSGITIRRGDGTVTFVPDADRAGTTTTRLTLDEPGSDRRPMVGYARGQGDLDGDGRDELYVRQFVPRQTTRGGLHVDDVRDFVVPGVVGPGVHEVDAVGIELPQGDPGPLGWPSFGVEGPMGDRNGNGTIDVEVSTRPHQVDTLDIVEGRELMRPGPGGRLASLPPPFERIDTGGEARLGAVVSTDRRHTELVRVRTVGRTRHVAVGPLRLAAPVEGRPDPNDPPDLHAYRDGGRNVLLLWDRAAELGADGSLGLPWMSAWDLDDPCAPVSFESLDH